MMVYLTLTLRETTSLMQDLDTISAAALGRLLRNSGVNLLVRDVARSAAFLRDVLGFRVHQQSADYALLSAPSAPHAPAALYQLHADATYHAHPLLNLLPENPPRGAGVELRLFECDPDRAEARARAAGGEVLQTSTDKPHGLRECALLDPDGYCWVPSRPLTED